MNFVKCYFIRCNYISANSIDYNNFTEKLLQEVQNTLQKESLTSIKNQIAHKIAMDDFTEKRDTQSQCRLGLIFNYAVFLTITQGLTKIDYKLTDLYQKRLVKRRNNLNKTIIYSSDTFVANESSETREVISPSFSRRVTKADEISVELATDINSEMEIRVPLKENENIGFKLGGPLTHELTITAPSHKITLDPFTKMNVTFDFYRYEDISEYALDFQLDESSSFAYPDYSKSIHYGDRTCCDNCFLFKDTATKTVPFLEFLRENHDVIGSITYGSESVIKLEEINGRFILRNLGQATEKITHFGVAVLFGTPEPI